MATKYPRFLFHATKAPEGQVFHSEETEPTEDGWVDTPAAFDPAYVAPPPADPADAAIPDEAKKAGYVRKLYPSHRFHTDGKQEQLVQSAEDDAKLDPAVWKNSPDPTTWDAPAAAAQAQSTPGGSDSGAGSAAQPVALTDAQVAEFQGSTVTQIVTSLETIASPGMVEALRKAEEANPKGVRVTVLKALDARLKVLQVPA